jgi:anti-sigma factor RsiW
MTADDKIEVWALHAYADGELEAHERVEVERHLENDLLARGMLDAIRREKAAFHSAFDSVMSEKIPYGIMAAASGKRPTAWPFGRYSAAAAALVLVVAGGLSGAAIDRHYAVTAAQANLVDSSFGAYKVYATEVSHPVEIAGDDREHLQQWLSRRIGVKFQVPDLTQKGYTLVGGRLLSEGDKPAGLLMYEDASKRRLTIYLAANGEKNESPMLVDQRGTVMTCYWVESDLVYAVSGEKPRAEMLDIALAAHEGFDEGEG